MLCFIFLIIQFPPKVAESTPTQYTQILALRHDLENKVIQKKSETLLTPSLSPWMAFLFVPPSPCGHAESATKIGEHLASLVGDQKLRHPLPINVPLDLECYINDIFRRSTRFCFSLRLSRLLCLLLLLLAALCSWCAKWKWQTNKASGEMKRKKWERKIRRGRARGIVWMKSERRGRRRRRREREWERELREIARENDWVGVICESMHWDRKK